MHYQLILPVAFAVQLLGTTSAMAIASGSPDLDFSSPASGLQARAEDAALDHIAPFPFPDDDDSAAQLEKAFDAIVNVPDSVLKAGAGPTKDWFKDQFPEAFRDEHDKRDPELAPRVSVAAVAACVFQLVKFIAENGPLPELKILRIKRLVNLLGGTTAAVKALLKARTYRELIIIGGPNLEALAKELLGYGGVATACFAWL